MNDDEVVKILRTIKRARTTIQTAIEQIEHSDHVYAEILAVKLYEQCWFPASPESVGHAELWRPENWELIDGKLRKKRTKPHAAD